jgi:glycosyltransferase involved in cell wall biosynthesis
VGGSGEDIEFYKNEARELKIEEQVRFWGHRTQNELAIYQKAADALLMPFPYNEHYAFYMSPLKMFEYMVSGRPIVASRLPSIEEILTDSNSVLIEPDDPQSLSLGIEKILADENLSRDLAKTARHEVFSCTWEKRAKKIREFIDQDKNKLIYCSSIAFSHKFANLVQVHSMAREFQKKIGENFWLGVNYKNIDDKDLNIMCFGTRKSYWLAARQLRFIKKNRIDFVYCREAKLLFFLILYNILFFRLKLKFIYEMHSLLSRNIFDLIADDFLARYADYKILLTENLKKMYLEKYRVSEKQILVCPDAVDMNIFDIATSKEGARKELGLPEDKKIMVYTGKFKTMGMEKGIGDILKALKILNKKDILFLAVGGSEDDIEFYKQQSSELGVENQVKLLGHHDQKDLAIFQKAADILLMPFPYNEHYAFYMSPLKMFEYMASKRPIIATKLPSVQEVLNDSNSVLAKPGNPEDLARKIEAIIYDSSLGQNLAEKAYFEAKNYTWEKRISGIFRFIDFHI